MAVLSLLSELPMHGYQIMQELEDRSGGGWRPSPGSIYPTLQLLADEGLIASESVDGRNIFSLTESGHTAFSENEDPPPWERFGAEGADEFGRLRRAVFQLGAAAKQVSMAGSPAQAEAAYVVINDARKQLYRLLAEDDVVETESTDDTAEAEANDD